MKRIVFSEKSKMKTFSKIILLAAALLAPQRAGAWPSDFEIKLQDCKRDSLMAERPGADAMNFMVDNCPTSAAGRATGPKHALCQAMLDEWQAKADAKAAACMEKLIHPNG